MLVVSPGKRVISVFSATVMEYAVLLVAACVVWFLAILA